MTVEIFFPPTLVVVAGLLFTGLAIKSLIEFIP